MLLFSLGQRRLDGFRVRRFNHTRNLHWSMNVVENGLFVEPSVKSAELILDHNEIPVVDPDFG